MESIATWSLQNNKERYSLTLRLANVAGAQPLKSAGGIHSMGVMVNGAGFIVTPEEAQHLGLGRIPGIENHIRLYRNGRDLTSESRNVMIIDLYGLDEDDVLARYPEIYQWVVESVKPERDANKDRT